MHDGCGGCFDNGQQVAEMESRLKEVEKAIRETEARLPAHSVKPPVMQDLLALEDEYENLVRQIRAFKETLQHGLDN